jgi:hypothetical protein
VINRKTDLLASNKRKIFFSGALALVSINPGNFPGTAQAILSPVQQRDTGNLRQYLIVLPKGVI